MTYSEMFEFYVRKWKRFDFQKMSIASRRRFLFIAVVVLFALFYILPGVFRWVWIKAPIFRDHNVDCVEKLIRPYLVDELHMNAKIYRSYDDVPEDRHILPYVGNGKFAVSIRDESSFYIPGGRALDLSVPFHPIVTVDTYQGNSQSATVVRLTDGIVSKFTCFTHKKKSVTLSETFYAHRLISSLFVQEMKISNPTYVPLALKLTRTGWAGDGTVKSQPVMLHAKNNMDYSLIEGQIKTQVPIKEIGFSVAYPHFPETIEINSDSQQTYTFKTLINYTNPIPANQIIGKLPELKISVRDAVKKVNDLSVIAMAKYHTDLWRNLWKSGFGISYSKAEGTLNGDMINATLYYILSQRSAFANDIDLFTPLEFNPVRTNELLSHPSSCYDGHSTLQASKLWSNLNSVSDINKIVSLWLLTLDKQGCHNLVEAGAEGVIQAFILSLGALQFTLNHLEFNTHPKELHRDYYIRRIRYGNDTLVNITVQLGEDNKASMYVNIDKNDLKEQFYGCDAACLDAPVKLTSAISQFPVKLTEPITAILYITRNKQHIDDLKHTIHVKEVNIFPAHEHHIIALHRHGHQLGGLPALFWVSIVFLIVVFHLFLAKLIYNEYCGGASSSNNLVTYEKVNRSNRYAL